MKIGTTGTETPFLSERDLPECARLSTNSEEDIIAQSRKTAEERDLQEAIKNSRQSGSKLFPNVPKHPASSSFQILLENILKLLIPVKVMLEFRPELLRINEWVNTVARVRVKGENEIITLSKGFLKLYLLFDSADY